MGTLFFPVSMLNFSLGSKHNFYTHTFKNSKPRCEKLYPCGHIKTKWDRKIENYSMPRQLVRNYTYEKMLTFIYIRNFKLFQIMCQVDFLFNQRRLLCLKLQVSWTS